MCGRTLSIANINNAPSPKPRAAGITLIKPSPSLISIAGDNRLQKLAATITPPVNPSIPSRAILLIVLNKKTVEAPKAVIPHVNRVAYKAPTTGFKPEKYSIIWSIFVY